MQSTRKWAEDEFGHLESTDVRHGRRLVLLASEVAARPAGTVTRACATPASREGAFRLLENPAVRAASVQECAQRATLTRCPEGGIVFVPIDGTSLQITDNTKKKGLGGIGSWSKGARGLQVMSALAVSEDGQPIGLVSQDAWVRGRRSRRSELGRPKRGGESTRWLDVLDDCRSAFAKTAPGVRPWYQADRGADCWQVISHAADTGMIITVRATHDRRLDGQVDRLWAALIAAPLRAKKTIEVPACGPKYRKKRLPGRRRIKQRVAARDARRAKVEIRATSVTLKLSTPDGRAVVPFNAVLVREIGRAKEPIEWLLLTTHPVQTRKQVLMVVRGYTFRWRIEEFHRVWKNGLCRVEQTQLRSRDAIIKWATILAAVATRAMRLAYQARTTPDAPATSELSANELEALIALREPTGLGTRVPTLGEAVRWLAELGGYTGPWNGPPGPTVIGRGLYDLLVVARAFENRAKRRAKTKRATAKKR